VSPQASRAIFPQKFFQILASDQFAPPTFQLSPIGAGDPRLEVLPATALLTCLAEYFPKRFNSPFFSTFFPAFFSSFFSSFFPAFFSPFAFRFHSRFDHPPELGYILSRVINIEDILLDEGMFLRGKIFSTCFIPTFTHDCLLVGTKMRQTLIGYL